MVEDRAIHRRLLSDLVNRVFDGSAKTVMLELLETGEVGADELAEIRQLIDLEEGRWAMRWMAGMNPQICWQITLTLLHAGWIGLVAAMLAAAGETLRGPASADAVSAPFRRNARPGVEPAVHVRRGAADDARGH